MHLAVQPRPSSCISAAALYPPAQAAPARQPSVTQPDAFRQLLVASARPLVFGAYSPFWAALTVAMQLHGAACSRAQAEAWRPAVVPTHSRRLSRTLQAASSGAGSSSSSSGFGASSSNSSRQQPQPLQGSRARSPLALAALAAGGPVVAGAVGPSPPAFAAAGASDRDLDLPTPGFSSIPEALEAMRRGELVVVLDDEERENEGDLICAADRVTPATMAFMVNHTSGVICVGMTGGDLDRLRIPLMVSSAENEEALTTAFTVTVDYRHGTSTGISAADRAATLRALADPAAKPQDFNRPGHIFPLRSREVRVAGGSGAGKCGR